MQGLLSKNVDLRSSQEEIFLFDTCAMVLIISEEIAKSNNLVINKLDETRNIVEASGAR